MRPRVLLAILLVAFNLRLAVVAVGPVIERIRADTGMSGAVAGLLTAIPFLCMGLFALSGIGLVRRHGFSRVLLGSLALVAGGSALRAWMANPALLVLTTIPIGVGIALAGVALQGVVKRTFPTRSGAVTGVQVAALSLGAAIGALTVLPAADALGWHAALAITGLPAAVAAAVWPAVGPSLHDSGSDVLREPARGPSRTAVVFGCMFGCQGMCYAALIAWVAAVYEDAGWTAHAAALATASIPLLTIPASLVLSPLSDGGDPLDSVDVSAWMLAIGFSMAATGPVLVGGLRDLTGGYATGVGALAVLAAVAGVLAVTAVPRYERSMVETPL